VNSPRLPSTRRASAGFTLVELLVSVSITTLMVTFIFTITVNVLKMWDDSSGTLSAENQAALIFSYLTQDLHSAVIRRDGNTWFLATVQNPQTSNGNLGDAKMPTALWTGTGSGVMKPNHDNPGQAGYSLALMPAANGTEEFPNVGPDYIPPNSLAASLAQIVPPIQNYRFGQAGMWVRFFSSVRSTNDYDVANGSVLRAVSYQIDRIQLNASGSAPFHYELFRSEARPFSSNNNGNAQTLSTFGSGYDLMAPAYNNPATGNNNTKVALEEVPVIRTPAIQQILGNDVIDFGIRVWARVPDPAKGGGIGIGKDMVVLEFPNSSHNLGWAATTVDGSGAAYSANNFGAGSPTYTDLVGNPLITTGATPAGASWTGTPDNMSYAFTVKLGDGSVLQATPAYVDVFLRILDSDGVKLISNIESGLIPAPPNLTNPGEFWWRSAISHSRVFVRRVVLPPSQ
jgi:hypothetical protein